MTASVTASRVRAALALCAMAASLGLGGCGYTALKAPCSADDGVPPGYDATPLAFAPAPRSDLAAPFAAASPNMSRLDREARDTCGPMKPI